MSTSQQPTTPPALVLASLLLVPAASYSFIRLFADSSVIYPIIAAAIISGGLSILLRTIRVSVLGTLAVSLLALFVLIELRYAPGTQRFALIPTRTSLDVLQQLTSQGVTEFQNQKAPVESVEAFVGASIVAAWLMAFLTEWGALRLRLAFEPVLPAALLFIFASILGSGAFQQRSTIVFAAAVLCWTVTQRVTNLATEGVWLVADAKRGPRGIAMSGFGIGLAALIVGLFLGPVLPGANAPELYYWRDRGDPTRFVISPYVSIQNQLVEQTDVVMFTVVSEQPSYWRLAGLDTYEDGFWQTKGKFEPESGRLPGAQGEAEDWDTVRQEFKIEALGGIWLPAAFTPSKIVESDVEPTWNSETSSLTVSSDYESSDGATYIIESKLAHFTPAELNAASSRVPSDIQEQYLALPDDLTSRVNSEALEITAGTTTRYEQMLALQEHFRGFEYNTSLGPREGDPVEQFLDERVGFCQQFSGTFALMARSLGAPARVAVGFTWGEKTENENEYRISGRHTHAWPEVWFDGLGWVAFEPTPGRGAPGTTHTQVAQAQDAEPAEDDPSTPSTTIDPNSGPINNPGPTIPDFGEDLAAPSTPTDRGVEVPWRLLAVVGVVLAYFAGLPAFRRLRRIQARRRASTPTKKIEVAWDHATEAMELGFNLHRRDAETRTEFAHRAAKKRRVPGDAVCRLANATTVARYSPRHDLATEASSAQEASSEIIRTVRRQVPAWRRWVNDIDPRRLMHRH